MKEGVVLLVSKFLDVIHKKSKSGEKKQNIEERKINVYSRVIATVTVTALFMCVIASLFPKLAITEWWFNLLEKTLEYVK